MTPDTRCGLRRGPGRGYVHTMPTLRLLAASAAALALALPSAAQAGTVTGFPPVYTGSDAPETVNAFTSGGLIVLDGDEVKLGGGAQCTPNPDPTRLDCQPSTTLSVNVLGGDDRIDASMLTGTNLVADGGVGGDYILDGAGQRHDQRRAGWRRQHRRLEARTSSTAATATTRPTTPVAPAGQRSRSTAGGLRRRRARETWSARTSKARSAAPATTRSSGNGLGNRLIGNGGNDSITGGTGRGPHRGQRGRRHDRRPRRALRLDRLRPGHRHAARRPGRQRRQLRDRARPRRRRHARTSRTARPTTPPFIPARARSSATPSTRTARAARSTCASAPR